jgi:hypothetical protein
MDRHLYAAVSTLFSGGDENTWFRDGGTRIRLLHGRRAPGCI